MIRPRSPDKLKARSMINAAELDMRFIEKLPVSIESGPSLVRGIYENFRMLGDAFLTARGLEVSGIDHHREMIEALTKLNIKASRPLSLLHELRKIRHQINYEGYLPTIEEANYVVAIRESLWKPLLAEVKKQIEKGI